MSWDIFVQELPPHVASVEDIPDDFKPGPIGTRPHIVDTICRLAPFANASDVRWIRVEGHGLDIEVSLRDEDPVTGFAFHVRGGEASIGFVAAVLSELNLRALDPQADTGVFEPDAAGESLQRWREYRERVLTGDRLPRGD